MLPLLCYMTKVRGGKRLCFSANGHPFYLLVDHMSSFLSFVRVEKGQSDQSCADLASNWCGGDAV
jgi:hypothetical protein